MITAALSWARDLAIAAPTQRLPPVTRATLPSNTATLSASLRRYYPDQVQGVGAALAPSQLLRGSSPITVQPSLAEPRLHRSSIEVLNQKSTESLRIPFSRTS